MLLFGVSIVFLDNVLLKLSRVSCLHGFMLAEVVHVVDFGKCYRIQNVFLHTQAVFVHVFVVVVALFFLFMF